MKRRDMRIHLFTEVYFKDFYSEEEFNEQCKVYLDENDIGEEDRKELADKALLISENISEIDSLINESSVGWKTSRMSKVDLAILRVGTFEMVYDEEVPVGVAINEAVELAKTYSNEKSSSFINGILGNIAKVKGLK